MLVEGTVNIQIILTHNAFNIELCILPLRTYLAPYLYIYLGFVAKGNDILYADRKIHLNTTCILLRKIFAKLYKGIYLIQLYFRPLISSSFSLANVGLGFLLFLNTSQTFLGDLNMTNSLLE